MAVTNRVQVKKKKEVEGSTMAERKNKISKFSTAKSSNVLQVTHQRQVVYNFFKRIYEREITEELLRDFPQKIKPLVKLADVLPGNKPKDAIRQLTRFTGSIAPQNLHETQIRLAADYARLFLSITKIPPHPSESVYREGALMQASRDEVMQLYWKHGVDINTRFTEPEDHIAVELDFMSLLCEKAMEELAKGNIKKAADHIQTQGSFLEDHLLKWVPKLVKDITAAGKTPFYTSLAILTDTFLAMDISICRDLLRELDIRREK